MNRVDHATRWNEVRNLSAEHLGLFMFGFFALTVQGIVRLIKSRQIARFR
jgi:hypothetical protein